MIDERELSRTARRQHGLLTLAQVVEAGGTRKAVSVRLAAGRWERVHPRVYRVAGAPETWEQRVLAACLSAGPDAVASHRAAARLWALPVPDDTIDITMPRLRAVELSGIVTHRSNDLRRSDVTVRKGIPVTKPARTLVDLGAVEPRWVVEGAVDAAVSRQLTSIDGLWWMLARVAKPGRSGCGVLRHCLEWRWGTPQSVLEGLFMRLVRDAGLPKPELQYEVVVNGRRRKIDAAFVDAMVAVELDGAETHATAKALTDDLRRQNDLVDAGWNPLRFGWADLASGKARTAALVRKHVVPPPPRLEQLRSA